MPRRSLPLAAVALAVALGAGCADDVAPAVRVNDRAVGNEELLDEVEQWAGNDLLLQSLQFPAELVPGDAPGSWSTELVGFVLGSRVGFELHRAEFERLGLELDQDTVDAVRAELFGAAELTDEVFAQFTDGYGDRLVEDVARQIAVEQALGEDYQAWLSEAYARADVDVNPRYGRWEPESGRVLAPEGPAVPATGDPAA